MDIFSISQISSVFMIVEFTHSWIRPQIIPVFLVQAFVRLVRQLQLIVLLAYNPNLSDIWSNQRVSAMNHVPQISMLQISLLRSVNPANLRAWGVLSPRITVLNAYHLQCTTLLLIITVSKIALILVGLIMIAHEFVMDAKVVVSPAHFLEITVLLV